MKLVSGQNAPLRSASAVLRSSFSPKGAEVDFAAFALGADGRVGDDSAMVFYNQTSAPGIALRDPAPGLFDVYTDLLPTGVDRIAFAAVVPDGTTFAALSGLVLSVSCGDDAWEFAIPTAGSELGSMVLAEIYRRNGGWKVRAVGQGYEGGLARLATAYGVEIASDAGATGEASPPPAPSPAARDDGPIPASAPPAGSWRRRLEALRTSAPGMADLVLEADAALARAGMEGASARTVLCLDVSTRSEAFIAGGGASRLAARMAALAFRLDPSGVLDAVLFGRFAHSFGAVDPLRASDFGADVLEQFGTEDARLFAPAAAMASAIVAGAGPSLVLVAACSAPEDADRTVLPADVFRATAAFGSGTDGTAAGNLTERIGGPGFDFQPPFGQMVGPWELEQASLSAAAPTDAEFYDDLLRHWPRWAAARRDAAQP